MIPEITIARGNVRFGSTTSPASIGASSRPANPKQINAKNEIVSKFENEGRKAGAENAVAEPSRTSATIPTKSRAAEGSHWASPPMFCTHFPVLSPTMFKTSAIASKTIAAVAP